MTSSQQANIWAIVPAAGVGKRMKSSTPKQYMLLNGEPVLTHTLSRLLDHPQIQGVIVAVSAEDAYWQDIRINSDKPIEVVQGGEERCHSVVNALQKLSTLIKEDDWVMVHDAARPCVRTEDLDSLIRSSLSHPVGSILAVPVRDTMKRSNAQKEIVNTESRENLWHALTPQMFRSGALREAISTSLENEQLVTDEASAMELQGQYPCVVEGSSENIKITHPEDIYLASFYLKKPDSLDKSSLDKTKEDRNNMNMRIGQGFDAHQFESGRALVIGGVKIDYELGLKAHSDGDVALHALCDALLGAAGLGDIGKHFPDTDDEYKNIDSRELLRSVVKSVQQQAYVVSNIDLTIIAQKPKMAPHINAMNKCIAEDLQIATSAVNVKATTTEGMGFTGRAEGIAASAVVMLSAHHVN